MVNLKKFRLPFRDDAIFSILAFTVFLIPLAFSFELYEKFETVKIALLLMLLGWAVMVLAWSIIRTRQLSVACHKTALWVAAALGGWILLSAFHAPTLLNGLLGTNPRFTSSAGFYLLILAFFLLLLSSLNRQKLIFLLHVLLADGLAVAVVGLLQSIGVAYYTGLNTAGLQRGPSLLGNPDFSSMFLAILLPVGLYLFVSAERRRQKLYYASNLIFLLAAVVVFASRGAWLGALAGLVLTIMAYVIFSPRKKIALLAFAVLVVGGGLFFLLLGKINPASLKQTFTLTESNISLRLYAWDIARQAMLDHPVLGTGPGNFQYYFQTHRGSNLADQAGVFDDVHNLFLQFGATLGLPFLLAFFALLAFAAVLGIKHSWQKKDLLPITLVVSLIVFSIVACFTPVASPCFVVLTLLLAGLFLQPTELKPLRLNLPAAWLLLVLGIICAIGGLAFLAGEIIFYQGYLRYYEGNFQSAYRLTTVARTINPTDQLAWVYRTASEMQLGASTAQVSAEENRYIQLYPYDQRGYLTAATISFLQFLQQHDQNALTRAIGIMNTDIAMDPNNSFHYSHVAFYYYAQGNLTKAQASVEYSLRLYTNNVPGWLLLARIHQARGELTAAINAIENAKKLNPDNGYLQDLSQQAKQATAKNFQDIKIPLLLDPSQIE